MPNDGMKNAVSAIVNLMIDSNISEQNGVEAMLYIITGIIADRAAGRTDGMALLTRAAEAMYRAHTASIARNN